MGEGQGQRHAGDRQAHALDERLCRHPPSPLVVCLQTTAGQWMGRRADIRLDYEVPRPSDRAGLRAASGRRRNPYHHRRSRNPPQAMGMTLLKHVLSLRHCPAAARSVEVPAKSRDLTVPRRVFGRRALPAGVHSLRVRSIDCLARVVPLRFQPPDLGRSFFKPQIEIPPCFHRLRLHASPGGVRGMHRGLGDRLLHILQPFETKCLKRRGWSDSGDRFEERGSLRIVALPGLGGQTAMAGRERGLRQFDLRLDGCVRPSRARRRSCFVSVDRARSSRPRAHSRSRPARWRWPRRRTCRSRQPRRTRP